MKCNKEVPAVKISKFSLLHMVKKNGMLYFLNYCLEKYGYSFKVKLGSQNITVLASPIHMKHFQKNNSLYKRSLETVPISLMRLFLGDGLITTEGEVWKEAREILQPIFQNNNIKHYSQDIVYLTHKMLSRYKSELKINLANDINQLSLSIIKKILLGESPSQNDFFLKITEDMYKLFIKLLVSPFPRATYFLNKRKISYINQKLDEYIFSLIDQQKNNNTRFDNSILNRLSFIKNKKTGEKLNNKQIRDHIVTLLFAGYETTSNLIIWSLYFLDKTPDIKAAILEEIDTVLRGEPPNFDTLDKMPKVDALIKEALRIAPTAPIFARQATEDLFIDGCKIPVGTDLAFAPCLLHHNPST